MAARVKDSSEGVPSPRPWSLSENVLQGTASTVHARPFPRRPEGVLPLEWVAAPAFLGLLGLAVLLNAASAGTVFALIVIAGAVAFIAWWTTLAGSLAAAAFGFLSLDGFVDHGYGTLGWSGWPDVARLLVLVSAALLVLSARELARRLA